MAVEVAEAVAEEAAEGEGSRSGKEWTYGS